MDKRVDWSSANEWNENMSRMDQNEAAISAKQSMKISCMKYAWSRVEHINEQTGAVSRVE